MGSKKRGHQVHQGGLATPAAAHQGHGFPRAHLEVDVAQDRVLGIVGELDALESQDRGAVGTRAGLARVGSSQVRLSML